MWDFLIILDMLNLETDYNKIPVRHNFDHMVLFLSSIICLIATFQQYFSHIMAVSFIGGGNQRTRRKNTAASHWQTLSHNDVHLALIEILTHNISGDRVVVNSTTNAPLSSIKWQSSKWMLDYVIW